MAPHRLDRLLLSALLAAFVAVTAAHAANADPAVNAGIGWSGDLQPIAAAQWNRERAAHLLERAGFGGTPDGSNAARLSLATRCGRTRRATAWPAPSATVRSDRKAHV